MHIKDSSLIFMLMMAMPAQAAVEVEPPRMTEEAFCDIVASYHETAAVLKEKGLDQAGALGIIDGATRRAVADPDLIGRIDHLVRVATNRVYQ